MADELSSFVFGKVQPQARDMEEAVLGGVMLEKHAYEDIVDILKPEDFYVPAHQHIFQAFILLNAVNSPIDIMTVTEQVRKLGMLETVGGAFYISELTNRVASSANIEFHARIVKQKAIRRNLISIASRVITDSYNDSFDELGLMDRMEREVVNLGQGISVDPNPEIANYIQGAMDWIKRSRGNGGLAGVPSGIETFDREFGGFVKGELVTIGARPGMGKTAFMITCAKNQAKMNIPSAIFSIEMTASQLVVRMASAETRINGERIRRGLISDHEDQALQTELVKMAGLPIYVDERSRINPKTIFRAATKMKKKYGIQVAYIDYLQITEPLPEDDVKSKTRDTQIGNMTRMFKNMAKELDIAVVEFAQLGRDVEKNTGCIPQLSNLRESGAIEQDSDAVIFLYRPEYYKYFSDMDGNDITGLCQAICAKHRNGKLFTADMLFESSYTTFKSWEHVVNQVNHENESKRTGYSKKGKGKTDNPVRQSSITYESDSTDPPPF